MSDDADAGSPTGSLPRGFATEANPTGAWAERRRLAAAIRRLNALTITTDAAEETLSEAASSVEALNEKLEASGTTTFVEAHLGEYDSRRDLVWADRSSLGGRSNPIAPPLIIERDGERFVGEATYSQAYEGAPGHVHGGHVAAAFDQLGGVVAIAEGGQVLTGRLNVRYRQPTPLERPIRFEAWLKERKWSLLYVRARAFHGEDEIASAEIVFMELPAERMREVLGTSRKQEEGTDSDE